TAAMDFVFMNGSFMAQEFSLPAGSLVNCFLTDHICINSVTNSIFQSLYVSGGKDARRGASRRSIHPTQPGENSGFRCNNRINACVRHRRQHGNLLNRGSSVVAATSFPDWRTTCDVA